VQHSSNEASEPAGHAGGFLRPHAGRAARQRSPVLLRRLLALALVSGVPLAAASKAAHAQVQVGGQPEAVHIEARDATLREVLDALQANFDLRYRSNDVLDTRITGTFNGPLRRVAARILDGYDFVIKITPRAIDVLVMRQNQPDGKAVAVSMPARAPSNRLPAPAMTAAEANRYERGLAR
jgi:hypothetical protein